ncbi:hypothetical protein GCM10029964_088600 [Kibdelosporangium lantanae]
MDEADKSRWDPVGEKVEHQFRENMSAGVSGYVDNMAMMVIASAYQDPNPYPVDQGVVKQGGVDPNVLRNLKTRSADPGALDTANKEMNDVLAAANDQTWAARVANRQVGDNSGVLDTAVINQLSHNPQAVEFARSCVTAKDSAAASTCYSQWHDGYERQAYVDELAKLYYYNGGSANWNGNTLQGKDTVDRTAPILENVRNPPDQQSQIDALHQASAIKTELGHAPVFENSIADPKVKAEAMALAHQMQQDQALLKAWQISPENRQAAADNPSVDAEMVRNLKTQLVENGVDPNLLTAQGYAQATQQYQGSVNTAALLNQTANQVSGSFKVDQGKTWNDNYTALTNQIQNQTTTSIKDQTKVYDEVTAQGRQVTPPNYDTSVDVNGNNMERGVDVQNRIIAGLQVALAGGDKEFGDYATVAGNRAVAKQLQAQGYNVTLSADGRSYTVHGNQAAIDYVQSQFTSGTAGKQAAMDAYKAKQNEFELNYLDALDQLPRCPGRAGTTTSSESTTRRLA